MEIKVSLSPHLYTQPRSQAIYGSLVETFGPYPQDYTRTVFNFYKPIVTSEVPIVNKTRMLFLKITPNVRKLSE